MVLLQSGKMHKVGFRVAAPSSHAMKMTAAVYLAERTPSAFVAQLEEGMSCSDTVTLRMKVTRFIQ